MQRDRIVAADRIEIGTRYPAAHVVLGMNLEPRDVGTRVDHGLMVLEAQPDPGPSRNRAALPRRSGPNRHALTTHADVFPPWILPQSPAGNSTNDFGSRAWVA